jgi:diguanylate cyclase (GGDEF)-like protein
LEKIVHDMKNRGTSRIGRKIGALVAISVLVSILAIASLLILLQFNQSIKSKKNELQATGYVYAAAIADYVAVKDKSQTLSVLRSIARIPGVLYATALDRENTTLAALGKITFLQKDIIPEEQGTIAMLTKGVLPVAVDIVRGGEHIGRLVLIADTRPLRNNLLGLIFATMLAAVAASTCAAIIAFPLQRRITRPILSLINAMRHIKEARDYTTKVDHKADDETGVLVDTFNSMISEISFRDTALKRLAYIDPLTGLPNRQFFQRQIDETIAKSTNVEISAALFLLDLDDFKQINDSFGHTVGDGLLMSVAALLAEGDASGLILARLGGDEFIIIAENVTSESEAQEKLAPFIAALYQPIKIMAHEIYLSTSVGVAMIPRDGRSSVELMRRADLALYSAKRQGHGLVHFFKPAMDTAVKDNTEIAQGLRHAIANNEFETHYQPQVDLSSGKVYGFECLIRWKHSERGFIPPAQFISVAESAGLINEIGKWILRDGCTQARAWIDAGQAPREISVNVSAAQTLHADFQHEVSTILLETGMPPHLLCLELTESLFIGKSIGKIRRMLDGLRDLGVLLSLDDFGTGYSSLSYLEKLPFDKLKIDQSFVANIETDVAKRKILSGIITLTHSLGMQVVAEGAETRGGVALLREMGADFVQGFALSQPVPADEAIAAAQTISREFPVKFGSAITTAHAQSKPHIATK